MGVRPIPGGIAVDEDCDMTTQLSGNRSTHEPHQPRDPGRRFSPQPARGPLPSAVVRGSLKDGLMVCLGLLASDPARFEAAAVAWHARWCAEHPGFGFAESRAALSALEALTGSDPGAAGRTLRAACAPDRIAGVEEVLDAWLASRRSPSP